MSIHSFLSSLSDCALSGTPIPIESAQRVLSDDTVPLLPLLEAAYRVRHHYWGNVVTVHMINNAQNGHCPEDCQYCPQAKTSEADIHAYPKKEKAAMLAEAKRAYDRGAHRYCMVFSGRGPNKHRIAYLADVIREIKASVPLEVCLSAGLVDEDGAKALKAAGLDRLNHNLNTSERLYPSICSTHTYADRMKTLLSAKSAGLSMCSGLIVGMGETDADILEVAYRLNEINAVSIPVNFLVPIDGNPLSVPLNLSPQRCLRILAAFRFINPAAELRAAAGRECHLRSLQSLALYPANSLFIEGYLNTEGDDYRQTLQLIKDGGFTIESTCDIDELLSQPSATHATLKSEAALHPTQ